MHSLTEEQRMILNTVSDIVDDFDMSTPHNDSETPTENIEVLVENGFWGLNIPEEYGGGGVSELVSVYLAEIIGRSCPDTAHYFISQSFIAPRAIEKFGSESAKNEYLPDVASGNKYIAIAMSEPNAGSDIKNMQTKVTEKAGELYLNGEKTWVSHYNISDAAVVWTRFPEGIGSVLLDLDESGVKVNNHFTNMSGHSQTHFFIDEVHIPQEHVLVRGENQFKTQLKALNWERIGQSLVTVAIAECAFDYALEYAKEREQFGQNLIEFQGIRWKLAEMAKQIEAARALIYRAARNAAATDDWPDRFEVNVAKLYTSQITEDVVSEALQIHGATGYQQGHPVEYLYRLARGKRISSGTDEIIQNAISNFLEQDGLPTLT